MPLQKIAEIKALSDIQNEQLTSYISVLYNSYPLLTQLHSHLKLYRGSILPAIIFAVSRLLQEYPYLNAHYKQEYQVALYQDINIGFAIDINKGLKVCTIYQANKLSLGEIEEKIFALAADYVNDSLQITDVTNSTFTITDLSTNHIHSFRPLINAHQAAILAICSPNPVTNLSEIGLTFDHHLSTGKETGLFLKKLLTFLDKLP